MIKITLSLYQFLDYWPESRKDQFSYEAKKAIFEYLENYGEETGEDIEFDPITICCEYTEYEDFKALQADYPQIETIEELSNHTQVIELGNGGIVIQQF